MSINKKSLRALIKESLEQARSEQAIDHAKGMREDGLSFEDFITTLLDYLEDQTDQQWSEEHLSDDWNYYDEWLKGSDPLSIGAEYLADAYLQEKKMKNININQLRMVIKEVVGGEAEEQPGEEAEAPAGPDAGALDSAGGGKEKSDVAKALQYIQKINNRGEYAQMLTSIVQHGANIPGAKAVLVKLYKQLPGMAKQMQEGKLNEDDVQMEPGGNWGQPLPGEAEVGMRDVESLAMDIVQLLDGVEHNDAVDVLTLAAESLGLAPPEEEESRPIGFVREILRRKLIEESYKRRLEDAVKNAFKK
jgi:hypothetical protein